MDPFYNQGKQNVENAYNTGSNTVSSFDPSSFGASWQAGNNSMFGNQEKQQNQYIQGYKDTVSNNPSITSLYNQGNEMFNVPQLQQQANTLNNAVLNTPNNVLNSAKGFNYDQNQVNNDTNLLLTRLSPLAQSATNQAQTAQGLAQGYVGAGVQQNQFNLLPVQQQGQMLSDLWSRQTTGFTTQNEQTLNGLVAKMQSGAQLSQQEMAMYSQLSGQEEQYQQSLQANNTAITTANIGNQFKQVPAGQNLVNTFANTIMNPSMLSAKTGMASYGQ